MSSSGLKENIFSWSDKTLILSHDCRRISKLDAGCRGNVFTGDHHTPLWRIWLFDEETRKLNNYREAEHPKQYWYDLWVMGKNSISSLDSVLVAKDWDEEKGLLRLDYTHESVDISAFFQFDDSGIIWWFELHNKSELPVYRLESIAGWMLSYDETNSFLMPEYVMSAIEYKPVYETEYTIHCTWDGFLVTSPERLTSLYAIQNKEHFLPTHTKLKGDRGERGNLAVTSATVCFRKKGDRLVSVRNKLASFADMREWADAYNFDNFGTMKKLAEKIDADLFEKISSAVLVPVAGDMKLAARAVKEIPGTAIVHTPGYMTPTEKSPIGWDSFPNYFPPNSLYGSEKDYQDLVDSIHESGHLFMPRNSFFYWTKGSCADLKYGVENLAMVRIDGEPRTANWCLDGFLMSPSSITVKKLLDEFYDKWKSIGADVNFTNVIAAIEPCGNPYDFHPDSPGPDLLYDQIIKLMRKYGEQMPMLSEGGSTWQVPFQTGLCLHPAWNPDHPGADYWRTPDRGIFVRYRNEPGVFLKNEYARFYPHNTGTRLGQSSIWQLTFSLLNSLNPKLGIASAEKFTQRNRRWLKILSHLGKTAFSRLFGSRLLSYEYDDCDHVFARYENATVVGNFSKEEYDCGDIIPDTKIAPSGFLFRSEDVLAGTFSTCKGKACPKGEILIVENDVDTHYSTIPQTDSGKSTGHERLNQNYGLLLNLRVKTNDLPEYANSQGAIPLIVPPQSTDGNTFELRYNMHYGTIQFLQKYTDYLICDLTAYDMELCPDTLYEISVQAGEAPRLIVNGRLYDEPTWYYVHEQVSLKQAPAQRNKWQFYCRNEDCCVPACDWFNTELVTIE